MTVEDDHPIYDNVTQKPLDDTEAVRTAVEQYLIPGTRITVQDAPINSSGKETRWDNDEFLAEFDRLCAQYDINDATLSAPQSAGHMQTYHVRFNYTNRDTDHTGRLSLSSSQPRNTMQERPL